MKEIRLPVHGMSCQGCVGAVTRALSALEGVSEVEVSLEQAEAKVRGERLPQPEALARAVEEAGFEVR